MTGFIFSLTLRQLIGRKSTLLLAGLCGLPLLLAVIFRLSDPDVNPERWAARVLFLGLMVTLVLPLTSLLLAVSVLGDEIEDGTAIYLLTKPIPRWQILLPKLAAAWLVITGLVLPSTLISGFVALEGQGGSNVVTGFAVAVTVGALAYATVFVLLSVATTRALVAGLIYVFIWEGAVTSIFTGTRYLSIRHYTLAIAETVGDFDPAVYDAYVNGGTAIVLLAAVILIGAFYANRRLERIEVREPT